MTTSKVRKTKRKMNKLKKKIEEASAELSEDKVQALMQKEVPFIYSVRTLITRRIRLTILKGICQ